MYSKQPIRRVEFKLILVVIIFCKVSIFKFYTYYLDFKYLISIIVMQTYEICLEAGIRDTPHQHPHLRPHGGKAGRYEGVVDPRDPIPYPVKKNP